MLKVEDLDFNIQKLTYIIKTILLRCINIYTNFICTLFNYFKISIKT